MVYKNLEQRMVQSYLDMFPTFYPCSDLPHESQRQLYEFVYSVYKTMFAFPEKFFKKILEDDAYPRRFNRTSYGKPKLYNFMKSDLKEIDDFLLCLYDIGKYGEVVENGIRVGCEIKKKQMARLQLFGLKLDNCILVHEKYNEMFAAWKYMSSRNEVSFIEFSRCMFAKDHAYMEEIYAALFQKEAINKLSGYFLQHSYNRYELARDKYTLDYVKNIADNAKGKAAPLGNSLFGDPNHIGLSFEYRPDVTVPQYAVLRIVKMKEILNQIENAPESVKEFVLKYQKKCNNCKYCTQTDKSGKKPKQVVVVDNIEICALYPGFNFCFTKIDDKQVTDIIDLIEFMVKVL